MALTKRARTVNRRIYFYRVCRGSSDSGYPIQFDPRPALESICAMSFTNTGRYLTDDNGDSICLWPISNGQHPSVRFSKIRRSALPQIEEEGALSELPISDRSGLVESIHGVFFENNIVGFEYNIHAPRVSRLGYYLTTKAGLEGPILSFDPILRVDVTQQLERLQEIRLLDIKASRGIASVLEDASSSLASTFSATERLITGNDCITIRMSISPSNRRSALQRFINDLRSIVRTPDILAYMKKGSVRGKCVDSGRVETVDLLQDQFVVDAKVVRLNERTRAVDERSMIEQIERAYAGLKSQLESATSIAS